MKISAAQYRLLAASTGGNLRSEAALDALSSMSDKPAPAATQPSRKLKKLPLILGQSETRTEALRQSIAILERLGERVYRNEYDLVCAMKEMVSAPFLGYELAEIGQRDARKSGTTKGFPDTAIRHSEWPVAIWFTVEVKHEDNDCSEPQRLLKERGGSVVCRSVIELLQALLVLEEGAGSHD